MPNDTTTLNGALRQLGETMAANLTTQGVPSTYDEGLTTLAGKILDIQGGGGTRTLTLTADKSILSYYDSDTATLSATLLEDGEPVTGEAVVFFNGSTPMGSAQTDSNGVATKIYTSAGVGDVEFTAKADNGTLVSEIFVLEDCILYDPLTSASGKWTIPSGVTSVYSDDGWKISTSSYKQIKLTEKLTSACSVEFTISDYYASNLGQYPPVIVYQYTNGETTPNQVLLILWNATSFDALGTRINHALIKGGIYKIEYDSTMKIYENDPLLASASNDVGLPTRFEWHMGANGRYAIYKDLKVKPL